MTQLSLTQIRQERMAVAIDFAIPFAIVTGCLSLVAAAITAVVVGMSTAILVASVIILVSTLAIGAALTWAMLDARSMLIGYVSDVFDTNQAHRDAMQNASIVQTNINTGDGIIKPKINAPRVTIRGKQVTWNQLNAMQPSEPKRIEIPREDWTWMLEQFLRVGHAKRKYLGETFPYSNLKITYPIYRALVDTLVEENHIVGRSEKASGNLVTQDIKLLTDAVDRAYPGGMVIELPAQAAQTE